MRRSPVSWHVDDREILDILNGILFHEEKRRDYHIFEYGEKKVFVKYFKEKGLFGYLRNLVSSRGKREYDIGKKLIEMSIPTPKPFGYGISKNGSYVVQEWIEGTTFLHAFMTQSNKKDLLFFLGNLLKTLKFYNVLHNDLHLDNILIKNGELFLIDLHKTVIKNGFCQRDEVLNLAHALNMIYDYLTEDDKKNFFQHYGDEPLRMPVEKVMAELREKWRERKRKRALANTSKIEKRGRLLWIRGVDGRISEKSLGLIKKDRKVMVERFEDHIKKYYRSRRRLLRAWENHIVLLYLGLKITPTPYCLRKGFFVSWGYIAMEDLKEKGKELDRYLDYTYDSMGLKERRAFIERLAKFFSMLFKNGISHTDMKACNIFVCDDGFFRLLDVEDVTFQTVDKKRLTNMLLQLNTTVPIKVRVKDRMRFFIRLCESLPANVNKKEVFIDIKNGSLKSKVVYEGTDGLKVESWG